MPWAACPPVSKGVPHLEGASGLRQGLDVELVGTPHPGRP